jgi:hypothetical protein
VRCPYCAAKLDSRATVCQTCLRDFAPFKQLVQANHTLEESVEKLEREVESLKSALAARDRTFDPMVSFKGAIGGVAGYVIAPIAIILLIHGVLIAALNLDPRYMYVGEILIPLLCGYALEAARRPSWFVILSFAILVAAGSVFGTSTTNYLAFSLPILPDRLYLPRFLFERSVMVISLASIALAYLLGAMIAVTVRSLRFPSGSQSLGFADALASFLAHNMSYRQHMGFEDRRAFWLKAINLVVSAATLAGVLWSRVWLLLHQAPKTPG